MTGGGVNIAPLSGDALALLKLDIASGKQLSEWQWVCAGLQLKLHHSLNKLAGGHREVNRYIASGAFDFW
jgi:hypothetical protein